MTDFLILFVIRYSFPLMAAPWLLAAVVAVAVSAARSRLAVGCDALWRCFAGAGLAPLVWVNAYLFAQRELELLPALALFAAVVAGAWLAAAGVAAWAWSQCER